jgi:hypothetical protein
MYRRGESVTVTDFFKTNSDPTGLMFHPEMAYYIDKRCTIAEVEENEDGYTYYKIKESKFWFSEFMIDPWSEHLRAQAWKSKFLRMSQKLETVSVELQAFKAPVHASTGTKRTVVHLPD